MVDATVVELCAQCMAQAAALDEAEEDLALSAPVLARDLADTHRIDPRFLLDAASRGAVAYRDASDLDERSFAARFAA